MLPLSIVRRRALTTACASPARNVSSLCCSYAASYHPHNDHTSVIPTKPLSPLSHSRAAVSPAGVLRPTRLLRRPQTIKPNPNEATSGQFEKSFEKITETIESRLPMRQRHLKKGNLYDVNYGEKTEHDMKQEAEEDLQGREKEKPAARQARSYFSDEDLSPEALHVRSPHLKVAQNAQRQNYDKKILKTTAEPPEYYYHVPTKAERQKRNAMLAAGWGVVGIATYVGLRKADTYMRTAG